ncbi:MAG: winged helix-turn-helix domain-containing protein [Candidatus Bathyarchaeia archaeon]
MSFNVKRDRIQVIAEILGLCRTPQTQTYIRRQTSISYTLLQSCLMHMLMRQWLAEVQDKFNQRKLVTTPKGMVFLEKWLELQKLTGFKNKHPLPLSASELKASKIVCH